MTSWGTIRLSRILLRAVWYPPTRFVQWENFDLSRHCDSAEYFSWFNDTFISSPSGIRW